MASITHMIYGKGGLAFHKNLTSISINFPFVTGTLLTGIDNPIIFLMDLAMMDTLQCCFSDGEYHLHIK
ncbi:hypothetical protein [Lewinella sp. LCG006]|uniref:hypothetical protein n=1 Tax=Lewinella sp. LCG006 TaxID=3231911 RepID=UPI00345FC5ED